MVGELLCGEPSLSPDRFPAGSPVHITKQSEVEDISLPLFLRNFLFFPAQLLLVTGPASGLVVYRL